MAAPSAHDILVVLEAAAFQRDQSQGQAQLAAKQLDQWQAQPGFHDVLFSIAQQKGQPPATRILALTQLKNGIDRHWRAGSTLTTQEQESIRLGLQQIDLEESDGRLVTLTAVIFASIARRDFPSKWPSLFDDLANLYHSAKSSSPRRFPSALKIIQKTITAFGTLRLTLPRKAYQDAAPKLFHILSADPELRTILESTTSPGDNARQTLFHAVLIFKCLRRLAIDAFESPHQDEACVSIWTASMHSLQIGMGDQLLYGNQWWMALMRQLVKLHLSMAQTHPITFSLLEPTSLVHFYWDAATTLRRKQLGETDELDEALEDGLAPFFILRALMLLRACFKAAFNTVHTMKFARNRDPEEPSRAREHIRHQVLTSDFVARLFEGLIGTYMMYSPGDVEEWTDDAEEWEIREQDADDAFEQALRPCAERLFLDITLWYKDLVAQPLIHLVERYAPSDEVFIKDATYSALGTAASRLADSFNFNQFFEQQLTQDIVKSSPQYNIIRRRIAILLAQWVPITDALNHDNKAKVYAMYVSLLDPSDSRNDQVVRVTAGKRFKEVGDDFGFDPQMFKPYASDILGFMVDLMIEVQLPENKLALLDSLRCIVERMDATVIQFADQIVQLLQKFWGEVEKQQLIKKAIVSVLAKLTGSLKAASSPLQQFVIPLLQQVCDPSSQENLYLWEDSLDLLHELIQQSHRPVNPALIRVSLDYVQCHFRTNGDSLDKLLEITESLLVLASPEIVQDASALNVPLQLCSYMAIETPQRAAAISTCLELLVRAVVDLEAEQGLQALVDRLTHAHFSSDAVDCILSCWSANQTHGPNRKDPPKSARSETYFFIVLARVLLNSTQAFFSLVQCAAQERGAELEGIMRKVIEEWFSHLDNVGSAPRTKLMVMALTQLLDLNKPWILSKLQDYLSTWTSIMIELRDGDEDKGGDTIVLPPYQPPQGLDLETMSPEVVRRERLAHEDPVHNVNLPSYVKAKLDAIVVQCGGWDRFEQDYLQNVDKDVWQQFKELF
ncbi:MAG: hypothetical protein Q9162_006286 [Coniocarpon cinnabarinum]